MILKSFVDVFVVFFICTSKNVYGHNLVAEETFSITHTEGINNMGHVPTRDISCRESSELHRRGDVGIHLHVPLRDGTGGALMDYRHEELDNVSTNTLVRFLLALNVIDNQVQALRNSSNDLATVIRNILTLPSGYTTEKIKGETLERRDAQFNNRGEGKGGDAEN
ncbi:hypothetical protein LXL04_037421 [Taraxacum kok-saghyz]